MNEYIVSILFYLHFRFYFHCVCVSDFFLYFAPLVIYCKRLIVWLWLWWWVRCRRKL